MTPRSRGGSRENVIFKSDISFPRINLGPSQLALYFPWRERFLAVCAFSNFREARMPIAFVFPPSSSVALSGDFLAERDLSWIHRNGVAWKVRERALAPVRALWHGVRPLGAAVAQG